MAHWRCLACSSQVPSIELTCPVCHCRKDSEADVIAYYANALLEFQKTVDAATQTNGLKFQQGRQVRKTAHQRQSPKRESAPALIELTFSAIALLWITGFTSSAHTALTTGVVHIAAFHRRVSGFTWRLDDGKLVFVVLTALQLAAAIGLAWCVARVAIRAARAWLHRKSA